MTTFNLESPFKPTGSQPVAIKKLIDGLAGGDNLQTLLGVTGSGKTFTMANVIQAAEKPTLVLAHNKTLAAQSLPGVLRLLPEEPGRVLRLLL